jgi:penicillin G amidase
VGTVPMGVAPVRGTGDPHFLNPGWDKAADWQGTVPLSTLGMVLDPPGGRVAAANNRTSSRPAPYVGSLFEPSSRAERILDQLRIYDDYTVRDAQVMQQDVVSPYAQRFLATLLPVLRRGTARYGTLEKQALSMLARWDGSFSTLDSAATIYAALQQRMIVNTFEDELGQQLFMDWCYVGNQPVRRIAELINEPSHPLFDDARTPQREDLSWIAIRSFIEAVQEVRQRLQTDQPSQWRWGSMHTITFGHRFGEHPLMRPVMDQGPFDMPGSGTTLNNGEWAVHHPYAARVAAAMRVISDLRDSIQYSVVPGGVSGQPLDPHYADQVQLWLKGGYVRLPVAPEPDVTFRQFLLFLPSRSDNR